MFQASVTLWERIGPQWSCGIVSGLSGLVGWVGAQWPCGKCSGPSGLVDKVWAPVVLWECFGLQWSCGIDKALVALLERFGLQWSCGKGSSPTVGVEKFRASVVLWDMLDPSDLVVNVRAQVVSYAKYFKTCRLRTCDQKEKKLIHFKFSLSTGLKITFLHNVAKNHVLSSAFWHM